jgi:very-short-patch-repair endonuclease
MLFRAIRNMFKPAKAVFNEQEHKAFMEAEFGNSVIDIPWPVKKSVAPIVTAVKNRVETGSNIVSYNTSGTILPNSSPKVCPQWFCVPGIAQSPAELKLAEELSRYDVEVFAEVAFHNFKSSEFGHYRYDFFLPAINLIIEYDSKQFHSDPERIAVDAVKTAYCWNNGITIKRLTNKHYYSMTTVVYDLMKSHQIRLR